MEAWLTKLPMPQFMREWILLPLWRAIVRLSRPEVRIVTGGISFYALFSIFPLIYLTLTLLFSLLPHDLSQSLSNTVDQVLTSAVAPLRQADLTTIRDSTPQGLTIRAVAAVLIVLYTASSGAKAAITGIRMVAGSERRSNIIRFQGVSLLMTTLLILIVWLLGALQLLMSFATERQGFIAFDLARDISDFASQLWLGKFIACFVIFYLIISLSLYGRINSGRSMTMGAAAGALCWSVATWAYHIYLQVSVLDTFYGALASVILGFIWLLVSVSSLLLGAALTVEWSTLIARSNRQKEKAADTGAAPQSDQPAE
ncbi:YhjD/YihY/BrkB family envelope integrity protein [Henriciella sp.]|uniref:YhjD/YihY/BrkB family envelope integrity protein n=1 Tax=Henriciella sp. TaxID=1968823 RepID=UPI0025C1CCCF|nr:YhjD/YihY/BrkB family envelope integrity protein [Henriciella sp.]